MSITRWLTVTFFCLLLSSVVTNNFFIPTAVSKITSVPEEIVVDGFTHNALGVFLFGTYEERHDFAKGRLTSFGKMPYDVEKVLKTSYGMNDKRVHTIGSLLEFCTL